MHLSAFKLLLLLFLAMSLSLCVCVLCLPPSLTSRGLSVCVNDGCISCERREQSDLKGHFEFVGEGFHRRESATGKNNRANLPGGKHRKIITVLSFGFQYEEHNKTEIEREHNMYIYI